MKLKTSTLDKIAILMFFVLLTLATLCFGIPRKYEHTPFVNEETESIAPYELSSFSAKQVGDARRISWRVTCRRDNYYFVLERSLDGQNYHVLHMKKGQASSKGENLEFSYTSYQHLDVSRVYYRLRLHEVQGTEVAKKRPILSGENMFSENELASTTLDLIPAEQN